MIDGDDGEQCDSFFHQLHPDAIEQIIEQQQFFNPAWTLGSPYQHINEGEEKKRAVTYPVPRPHGISEGLDHRYATMNGSSTSIMVSPLEVFASSDSLPSYNPTGSSSTDNSSLTLTPRSPRIGAERATRESTPEAPIHSPRSMRKIPIGKKVRKTPRGRKNRYTEYWTYEDELKWGQAWQYEMRKKLARKIEPNGDPGTVPIDSVPVRSQSVPHHSSYQREPPSRVEHSLPLQSALPLPLPPS